MGYPLSGLPPFFFCAGDCTILAGMLYFGDTVGIRPAARLGMDGRQIFWQGGHTGRAKRIILLCRGQRDRRGRVHL